MAENENQEAVNPLDAVVAQITASVEEKLQSLHDLARQYRQASGTKDAMHAWIEESELPEVVKKRTQIKNALAKIAEARNELEAMAKEALIPEGYDSNALAKEFKELRTKAKTVLLQSKGIILELRGKDYDVSNLDQLLENLPNISGSGATASGKSPQELIDARAWLAANGWPIKKQGRISGAMLEAYDKKIPFEEAESNEESGEESGNESDAA